MTKEEIKKALECCKQNEIEETCRHCLVCPASIWDYEKTYEKDKLKQFAERLKKRLQKLLTKY